MRLTYRIFFLCFIFYTSLVFSVRANCIIGDKAIAENRYKDAASYYYMCIDKGEAEAGYKLGSLYYQGIGGKPVDKDTARTLFKIAAERGNTAAQGLLGVMLITGDGGEINRPEGYKWLLLANETEEDKWFYFQRPKTEEKIKEYLMRFSKRLTNEEKATGKRLAGEWKIQKISSNARELFSSKEYASFIRRYNSSKLSRREAIKDFINKTQSKEKQL